MKYGRDRLALALALAISYDALHKIKRAPTKRVSLAVAARVDLAEVLEGTWPRLCPHCGRDD